MKKVSILIILVAGIIVSSCQKKKPDFVNSIPDNAFVVVSMHPMQIHKKGQLNTLENLKRKIKTEILKQILDDPLSSGLMLDEYAYLFVTLEGENPEIGAVAGMSDIGKFEALLKSIDEEIGDKYVKKEGFTMVSTDEEGAIGWNEEQVIMLFSPDEIKDEEAWGAKLESLFNLAKEESITSMVDFNDFTGKMKDLNAWISSDKMRDVLENLDTDMEINLPVTFYNNYAQIYCEFEDGVMHVTSETHFSEEVEKNVEEYLVMKSAMNKDMLKLAPGGDLLLAALAGSFDLEKLQKVMKDVAPPEASDVGNQIEQAIGVPANELWQAFTGDFVIAINGIEGESMIPVELFIGLGIKNEVIQDKLMGKVENMAQVEKEGDFFVINVQGIEIYSGILDGIWVITNTPGYKSSIEGGGLKTSLPDSKFKDFTNGSMGMYLNLDLSSYPSIVRQQLSKNPGQQKWLEYMTESFRFMGMSAGNYTGELTLETNKPNENSLYTIMKMTDLAD